MVLTEGKVYFIKKELSLKDLMCYYKNQDGKIFFKEQIHSAGMKFEYVGTQKMADGIEYHIFFANEKEYGYDASKEGFLFSLIEKAF